MSVNQKLTNVIRGRVIRKFKESAGELVIGFNDRSTMKIREMETNSPPLALGAQIKEVEEDGVGFTIRCEDGTSLSMELTIPGSSVSVRDENEQVEYLG
jgi:L-asparaginase II